MLRSIKKFRFKNKLVSPDSTVIGLCVSLSDWAMFRRTKRAVKLHLLLDHDGYLPCFGVITESKVHDRKVAWSLSFEPGTVVVDDRGYTDYRLQSESSSAPAKARSLSNVTRRVRSGASASAPSPTNISARS